MDPWNDVVFVSKFKSWNDLAMPSWQMVECRTEMLSNPHVACSIIAGSVRETPYVVYLRLLFRLLGPGEGSFEHTRCADIAIATPSLHQSNSVRIVVRHGASTRKTYHKEVGLWRMLMRMQRKYLRAFEVLRERCSQVRIVNGAEILWLRSIVQSNLARLHGKLCCT